MNPHFQRLVKLFRKLPGVGPRQAARFVLALLAEDSKDLKELGQAIVDLKDMVHFCRQCFNITDDHMCLICSDKKRDVAKVLVVEKVTDLDAVEKTGLYKGLYHVLGGSIDPVNGAVPETLRLKELEHRVIDYTKKHDTCEIIIATNATTAGETTALYIREMFKDNPAIRLTRLARGLASGSNLEYTDELTLKHALEQRK